MWQHRKTVNNWHDINRLKNPSTFLIQLKTVGFCLGVSCILSLPSPARADMFGATDSVMIARMTAMLKSLNEQLKEVKKQVNLAQQLRDLESVKQVREISEGGDQLAEMFGEALDTVDLTEDIRDEPERGFQQTQNELNSYIQAAERAGDQEGIGRAYRMSRVLGRLDRLSVLGQAQEQVAAESAKGLSEVDATRSTSTSTAIMTQLVIRQEQRIEREKLQVEIANQAFDDLNQGMMNSYSNMK